MTDRASGPDHMIPDHPMDPREAVNSAIQNLVASRLGRGFIPLGLLFVWGSVAMFRGGELLVPAGAVLSGATMLCYGLRIVQQAFGRPERSWMVLASVGGVIPPIFSLYVFGWLGLRGFTLGPAASTMLSATLNTVLGVRTLRSWMRVVEIEELARIMTGNLDGEEGPA
ncbi:MAG: hypothetical protein ACPGPI_01490 [Longimicrobiales bacterium]